MLEHYILAADGRTPKLVDFMQWAKWFEVADRIIGRWEKDGVLVSTVFLGLDHNYSGVGPPVLWETMIFGGEHDEYQERYTSHDDALIGHKAAVDLVLGAKKSTGSRTLRLEDE